MKFPDNKIFWQNIASPYLKLIDLAWLEIAIDNRECRRRLMLPMPIDETMPGDDELPPYTNPYNSIFRLNTYEYTDLESEDMREWCERRRIVVERVQLSFIPVLDRIEGLSMNSHISYNMLNYIIDLDVEEIIENVHIVKKIFSQLHSLKKFSFCEESIGEPELFALIKQSNINMNRLKEISPGPCSLDELKLNVGEIGVKALKYMIGNLTSIRKIMFAFADCLRDDMLELMALRWSNLTSIDFVNTRINDSGLDTFRRTKQRFEYIRLVDIEDISIHGIKSLLTNSSKSLAELSLSSIRITEKDVATILQLAPNLTALSLDYLPDCAGTVIRVISKKCPNLIQLKIHELDDSEKVRDNDIQAFVTGCPKIERLHLTGFTGLTPKSVDMIDHAYSKTMTKFWMNDRKFLQRCRRTQFSTCLKKLVVEMEHEDFEEEE